MREIKFRAKDKLSKALWQVKEIDFKNNTVIVLFRDHLQNIYPLDEVTLMQYTGLQDKNSKEIYEGDIVKADSNEYDYIVKFGEYPNEHDYEYKCNGWYTELVNDGYKCSLGMTEMLEVIGNIYENPNLLEG